MQNNPHSRRVREIFPAFLGKVRKETLSVTCGDSSPEGGAFRYLPVSRAKPPPFGGGGFAKQRRRGFAFPQRRAFAESGAADDYPFRLAASRQATFPKGTAYCGDGKVPGRAQRLPLGGAGALAPEGVTPPRENGIAERPQTLRYSEIINILSAIYAQSNAARILNRPALGGLHHKIRAFGNAVLRKVPLLQRHPPGGKIRVACALPRL